MNTREKSWAAPQEHAKKAPDRWERAITVFEWAASGFIGLLFGMFTCYYLEQPIWLSIGTGLAIACVVYLLFVNLAKKYR